VQKRHPGSPDKSWRYQPGAVLTSDPLRWQGPSCTRRTAKDIRHKHSTSTFTVVIPSEQAEIATSTINRISGAMRKFLKHVFSAVSAGVVICWWQPDYHGRCLGYRRTISNTEQRWPGAKAICS
jgi:hypothetical protein